MNTFAHKNHKGQSRTVTDSSKQGDAGLQLASHRPAAITEQALDESLNQSAKVQSQIQLQQMFDQSPRVVAQMKLAEVLSGRKDALQTKQAIQRQEVLEDEEPLQGKSMAIQKEDMLEEEEPLQGKFEPLQRNIMPEDEEPRQLKTEPVQKKENRTGLPDNLKAGVENLSGLSMDDVRVHYNSSVPATVQALAYTQGTEIHVGPGQEQHLAHEAWHVAQQKQGRVRPTLQMSSGIAVNDDSRLEREADVMGTKALTQQGAHQLKGREAAPSEAGERATATSSATGRHSDIVQRAVGFEYELDSTSVFIVEPEKKKKKSLFSFFSKEEEEPEVELKKGQSLSTVFTGFDLSVDSTPTGGFDVEVRIDEVSDTDPSAKDQLMATVYQVFAVLKKLNSRYSEYIPASEFGGPPNVMMFGDFGSGSIQATAGLNLTALYEFLSGAMGRVNERRMNQLESRRLLAEEDPLRFQTYYTRGYGQGSDKIVSLAHEAIAQQYPMLNKVEKEELAAVISSIATIPIAARTLGPLEYAKSATTLLARTDYATIVNQLPSRIFSVVSSKDRWRILIMSVINGFLYSKDKPQAISDDPIYPPGSIKGANLSLKLGEWLESLAPSSSGTLTSPGPKDLLTSKNYPRNKYPQDDTDQLESLGGFGSKTDVGVGNQPLPIFEFRKYLKVPLDHLPIVIEGIWNLIYQANRIKKLK